MSNLIDLTGQRFGRWVVLEKAPPRPKSGGSFWVCKCDCGTVKEVYSKSLIKGTSSSCGCWRKEWASATNTVHGLSHKKLHRAWGHMIDRCYRPKTINYERYGGRGITVCDEWKVFINFAEWALNNGYADDLTLDRIDNNKGYCPENCRWVGYDVQANNKSNNHYVEIDGVKHSITEWARIYGISPSVIYKRISNGFDDVTAVTMPKRKYICKKSE